MKYHIFTATVFALAVAAPAHAQVACDDASMQTAQAQIDALTDPAKAASKETAMKEMEMATAAKNEGNTDACVTHINNAMTAAAQ